MPPDVYYDPYDFQIDEDPYPVWKRLRDERPLYYNDKYDFYAVSRFDDVEAGLKDFARLQSGRGTLLEIIKSDVQLPKGMVIFEDPPSHQCYRGLLSRVFTPRRILELEPKVRKFCADALDPLVGQDGFDFVVDLGAKMPMRVIGMLLGIPEEDQQEIRNQIDSGLRLESGEMPEFEVGALQNSASQGEFSTYIDWRAKNPSDDLMTALLQAEFEDHTGVRRRLTREEVLGYVGLLAAAGNETTTKLIGWAAKLLSENPDQRRALANDPTLIPNAVEEVLRYEAPSPIQARFVAEDVEYHGTAVPKDSTILLLNASANRDERKFEDADRFDVRRQFDHHLSFGYGIHFCLGAALARLEAQMALEEVLKRFPDWTVDLDRAVRARTSTVRGWDSLPVVTR
ncbi:MAG: cytochrome P450 [Candidatus Binatia bacterium]|nr:cytochrome P450 [Candidatus Binatia bacterium]